MTRWMVLAGLVSVEKITLACELADHFARAGQRVALLDQVARLPIDSERAPVPPLRLDPLSVPDLLGLADEVGADVVIYAASEMLSPEMLITAVEDLRAARPDLALHSIGLLDLRTCDCFPGVRLALEAWADQIVHLPYALDAVLARLPAAQEKRG